LSTTILLKFAPQHVLKYGIFRFQLKKYLRYTFLKHWYNFNHIFKDEGETDPAIWTLIHNQEDELAEETTYEECYLYFMQNLMNMVIQPIKQFEAEYTTVTEIYNVMLSV
jgi:hypothetical protein